MDGTDSDNKTRDDELIIFCPTCASSQPRLLIAILDSRKGKTVNVFECQERLFGMIKAVSVGGLTRANTMAACVTNAWKSIGGLAF